MVSICITHNINKNTITAKTTTAMKATTMKTPDIIPALRFFAAASFWINMSFVLVGEVRYGSKTIDKIDKVKVTTS